jgi:hypothetical protein
LPACQGTGRGSGEQAPAKAQAAAQSAESVGHERHLLLVVEHDRAGFRVRQAQLVASSLPAKRFADARSWRAQVEDGAGQALYSVAIPASNQRRAEFSGPDGGMQAVHFEREEFSFAMRVPLFERGARIRLWESERELGVFPYPTVPK